MRADYCSSDVMAGHWVRLYGNLEFGQRALDGLRPSRFSFCASVIQRVFQCKSIVLAERCNESRSLGQILSALAGLLYPFFEQGSVCGPQNAPAEGSSPQFRFPIMRWWAALPQ